MSVRQAVAGPLSGYEVNVLFLPTARHDPGRFFARLLEITRPLADLLLLTLNVTPQNRTRNTVAVFVGWNLQWMPDRPAGISTQQINFAPADHEWAVRACLIDETNVPSPEVLASLVFHELGHAFGVFGADHVGEGGPDFIPRWRARIQQSQSHRR